MSLFRRLDKTRSVQDAQDAKAASAPALTETDTQILKGIVKTDTRKVKLKQTHNY